MKCKLCGQEMKQKDLIDGYCQECKNHLTMTKVVKDYLKEIKIRKTITFICLLIIIAINISIRIMPKTLVLKIRPIGIILIILLAAIMIYNTFFELFSKEKDEETKKPEKNKKIKGK